MIFNHDTWWSTFFRSTYFINFDFWNHLLFWKWTVWLILKGMCWLSVFYQKLIIFLFSHFFFFQKIGPKMLDHEGKEVPGNRGYKCVLYFLLHSFWNHCDPCNPISSHQCNLFMNHTIFCSKSHLFPGHWEALSKTKQPIRFQGLFIVTNQIRGLRRKDKFCTF